MGIPECMYLSEAAEILIEYAESSLQFYFILEDLFGALCKEWINN